MIVVGRGAMWSGAGEAVLKLAERIGALIATTLMAKTWLERGRIHVGISGIYGTRTAMQLFQEADCVIAIGASLNRYTTEHGYLYPDAQFVHLDSKPHVMMGGGRAADCYVQSDARAGVEALESRAREALGQDDRLPHAGREGAARRSPRGPHGIQDRAGHRRPARGLPDARRDGAARNRPAFTGSGATAGFSNMLFNAPRPLVLAGHFFGCIGQMLPAAMGAVVATGNKPPAVSTATPA